MLFWVFSPVHSTILFAYLFSFKNFSMTFDSLKPLYQVTHLSLVSEVFRKKNYCLLITNRIFSLFTIKSQIILLLVEMFINNVRNELNPSWTKQHRKYRWRCHGIWGKWIKEKERFCAMETPRHTGCIFICSITGKIASLNSVIKTRRHGLESETYTV